MSTTTKTAAALKYSVLSYYKYHFVKFLKEMDKLDEYQRQLEALDRREALTKSLMEQKDKYQDAIENERNKAKYKKAQDEYIRNISKLAPQNERLSLEFSKLAGLALYYEMPVDEKTLSLALNYVNHHHKR